MKKFAPFVFGLLTATTLLRAQITAYYDRSQFLNDARLSGAALANTNFDSFAPGTDLTGATFSGATLTAPGSGPLTVIAGATGVRFAMSPSSGLNVLSPGGSNSSLEDDDLSVTFAVPVQAAGIDVIFDVPDGASYVAVYFYDISNNLLATQSFIPSPNGAPGYQFVGLVGDTAVIARMVFDEFDNSAADDHVAYDSLVTTVAIPEPASAAALLALAAVSAPALRRLRGIRRV